jgi:Cu/Ag efflux protein CusF
MPDNHRHRAAALIAAPVPAQTASDHTSHHADAATKPAPATDGEIRKVDKSAGKLTIRHGEIRNLEMPAMTMVFAVKDPAVLDRLKEGDRSSSLPTKSTGSTQ